MGKVRTETVKRAARELVERFPERFGNDFVSNKAAVNEVLNAPSKRLRNRIAGYVTRLKVVEANKATLMQMTPEAQLGLADDEEGETEGENTPADE